MWRFFELFPAILRLALAFAGAAWRLRSQAQRDLALPSPDALTVGETRRFRHYFFGTTYLAVVFAALRGHGRSRPEQCLFANLAALAAFFDDLTERSAPADLSDYNRITDPRTITHHASRITSLEAYGRAADPRGLALHFLLNLRQYLPSQNRPAFENCLEKVFQLETVSEKSGDDGEKGGYSVLLFRLLLTPLPGATEAQALYEFGRLVQYCDDVFDVWFDRRAGGVVTVPLRLLEQGRVGRLIESFDHQAAALKTIFLQMPGRGARRAWVTVHLLVAVTRVALRHYQKLQKRHGALPLDDRAAMVVDMGRWPNRWQFVREVLGKPAL